MEPLYRVLAPAVIRWDGDRPVSVDFGDVYHGTDGTEEAERVFLEPARFDERAAAAESFTVGELGFGLGRNFALAAERFLARSTGRLHYVAFEQAPVRRDDLERAARASGWAMHRCLVDALPPAITGWHRRRFAGGRVLLSLYFGDVVEGLTDLTGRQGSGVDAWFFDGFAPRCNPEMWSAAVCDAAATLSRPGATITTYSSAGVVKRAEIALRKWRDEERPAKGEFMYHPPPTTAFDPQTGKAEPNFAYGYVAEAVEVEVDIETGEVRLLDVICANDVGKVINLQQLEGQIEGAVVQAQGYALMEYLVSRDGKILNPYLSTYLIPTSLDVPPRIKSVILENPDPIGPWGVRGMAEMPFLPLAPAIAAAIYDATGAWIDSQPFTAQKVVKALRQHGIGAV